MKEGFREQEDLGQGAASSTEKGFKLWSLHLSEADKRDRELVENWNGDTKGILIFTGLFSATVAAFIVESYKLLKPDSDDTSVLLLAQISSQIAAGFNGSGVAFPPPSLPNFHTPSSGVKVNVFWFLSLVVSLTCALLATLVQQWGRRYLQAAQFMSPSMKRAQIRAYLFDGLEQFGMQQVTSLLPALLHAAVFLFFAGILEFLYQINQTVAIVLSFFLAPVFTTYLLITALSALYPHCPYQTPFTAALWHVVRLSQKAYWTAATVLTYRFEHYHGRFHDARKRQVIYSTRLEQGLQGSVEVGAFSRDLASTCNALQRTVASLDTERELDAFLEGVLNMLRSEEPPADLIVWSAVCTELSPIREFVAASCDNRQLSPNAPMKRRAMNYLMVLWNAISAMLYNKMDSGQFTRWSRVLLSVDRPQPLPAATRCLLTPDRTIAITASCTIALELHMYIVCWTKFAPSAQREIAQLLFNTFNISSGVIRYDERDEIAIHRPNFMLANLTSLLANVHPYFGTGSGRDEDLETLWRTLSSLYHTMDPESVSRASRDIQQEFMRVRNAVVAKADATTPPGPDSTTTFLPDALENPPQTDSESLIRLASFMKSVKLDPKAAFRFKP